MKKTVLKIIILSFFLSLCFDISAQSLGIRDSLIYKSLVGSFCEINSISEQTKKEIISYYDNYVKTFDELDKTPRTISSRGTYIVSEIEIQQRMQNFNKLDGNIKKILGNDLYKKYLDYCFKFNLDRRENRIKELENKKSGK